LEVLTTLVLGLKVLEPWLSGDIARCLKMHLMEIRDELELIGGVDHPDAWF